MNETGYRNLIQLVSKAYLEGFYYKPRIDMDLLREAPRGPDRDLGLPLVDGLARHHVRPARWTRLAAGRGVLARSSRDRYYLEMQRHGIADQDLVNAELVKMSGDLNLPLLATNDAHYLEARRPRPSRRAAVHRHGDQPRRSEALQVRRPRAST